MIRLCTASSLVLVLGGHLWAQPSEKAVEVSVREVLFDLIQDRHRRGWWEVTVVLEVVSRFGGAGRFADNVRLQFNVALESARPGTELKFYRAAVTAPALDRGQHEFRFYLPPAVVRRDRLLAGARFWLVTLSMDGAKQPLTVESVSRDFSGHRAVENFLRQIEQAAPANDGVLLPEHLTPWAGEVENPVVVRREAYDQP